MSCTFENLEKNKVKITFSVTAEKLEEGIQQAYNKNKSKINIPGFRKGKAPRKIIELNYGKGFFFEDGINNVMPESYSKAIEELNLDVVSRPEISIENISVEEGAVISAEVYIKPEVVISSEDYKGVTYNKVELEVNDEDIQAEINKVREQNSRIIPVTDRSIKNGDIVTLDFEGFVNGNPFEGGKGTDYDLTIGSKTFIDTFEEQLVGHEVGDDIDVNVTFPENYGKEELSGKEALFKVEIKDIKIKELPEVNDDFAQDVSEFNTLEEYKVHIKDTLEKGKMEEAKNKKQDVIVKKLIEKATMDVPQVMIETQIDTMINNFANQIRTQGMSLEVYLQYVGQDIESLREAYRQNADVQVKARLIFEKISELEAFEISEEELDKEIERLAKSYSMEKEKLLKAIREEDKEGLTMDLKVKKALDFVIDNSVEI